MHIVLMIVGKEACMKHRVDLPGLWQLQLIVEHVQYFLDDKRSFVFGHQLPVGIGEFEVSAVYPDLFSLLEWDKGLCDSLAHDLPCKFVGCQGFVSSLLDIGESVLESWVVGVWIGSGDSNGVIPHHEIEWRCIPS